MRTIVAMSALCGGLLLAAPVQATEATEPADPLQEIKANCAAEWPGDFEMQAYCVRRQAAAVREVHEMLGEDPADHVRSIAARCTTEWPGKVSGQDWEMVAYCMQRQISAYEQLLNLE